MSSSSLIYSQETASYFLEKVFSGLDEANLPYCVERNYENYPSIITGDVDILVRQNDLKRAVQTTCVIAQKNNWRRFILYQTDQAAHLGFYSDNGCSRFVLVIEYFSGGVWRGLNFLHSDRVISFREPFGITWKPHASHQAIMTLIHHLLYNGKVYEKYKENIYSLYKIDSDFFKKEIRFHFGKKLSYQIAFFIENKNWKDLEKKSRVLRRQLIYRASTTSLLKTLKSLVNLRRDLKRKPQGLIINIISNNKSLNGFAESIIKLGNDWHIFVPPRREIVNLSLNDIEGELTHIKAVVKSGGVVVLIYPSEQKITIEYFNKIGYHNPIILINKYSSKISISVDDEKYLMEIMDFDSMAIVFWNFLLKQLTSRR